LRLGLVQVLPVHNSANGFYDFQGSLSRSNEFVFELAVQNSTATWSFSGSSRRGAQSRRVRRRRKSARSGASESGFTLVETLTALLILTFGLLATGQLIFIALSSTSLARSKGSAILAAQSKLEFLSGLYRHNPTAADLAIGTHGPEQVESTNPVTHSRLNRYDLVWSVAPVPDPRPGKILKARRVTVTVTPIGSDNAANKKASLNKGVNLTTVFSETW